MLISAGIFNTVEFYIIFSIIAAAVIAAVSLPERKGEVRTHLLAGELVPSTDAGGREPGSGSVTFSCLSDNSVMLRRDGLSGVSLSGAVSLVVKVSGFDITIDERITPGAPSDGPGEASSAVFRLDFLAPEWYHIRYESEFFSEHAALSLHVRDGIVVTKPLIH